MVNSQNSMQMVEFVLHFITANPMRPICATGTFIYIVEDVE